MAVKTKENIPKIKCKSVDYKPQKVLHTPPLARTVTTYVISTNNANKNIQNTPYKTLHAMTVNPEKAKYKICQRTTLKSNISHHMKRAYGTSNNYKCINCEKIFTTKYSWKRHSQTHNIHTGIKFYIPVKLDTKSYKLDPSIDVIEWLFVHSNCTGTGSFCI